VVTIDGWYCCYLLIINNITLVALWESVYGLTEIAHGVLGGGP
jgi:hypothetical protein